MIAGMVLQQRNVDNERCFCIFGRWFGLRVEVAQLLF